MVSITFLVTALMLMTSCSRTVVFRERRINLYPITPLSTVEIHWVFLLPAPPNASHRIAPRIKQLGLSSVEVDILQRQVPWNPGTWPAAGNAPDQTTYNLNTYDFAFWHVVGKNTPGQQNTGRNGSFNIGTDFTFATAYYLPHVAASGSGVGGPVPPPDHSVYVDAFDLSRKPPDVPWMDEDFVEASPDDSAKTLTKLANLGYFDSDTAITVTETITAKEVNVTKADYLFDHWESVPSLSGPAVTVNPHGSFSGWAFYWEPPRISPGSPDVGCDALLAMIRAKQALVEYLHPGPGELKWRIDEIDSLFSQFRLRGCLFPPDQGHNVTPL